MTGQYFVPLDDFASRYENPTNGLDRYLKPAIQGACQFFLGDSFAAQAGEMISGDSGAAYRDWVNSVCHPLNPGTGPFFPEPASGINGGQCKGAPYRVNYQIQFNDGRPPIEQVFNAFGPISLGSNPPDSSQNVGIYLGGFDFAGNPVQQTIQIIPLSPPAGFHQSTFTIESVTRTDGQPDNCGNQSRSRLPSGQPSFPPSTTDLPSLPGYPDRPGLPVSIPNVTIPVGFINPTVNINIGPIKVVFDFRGASLFHNLNLNVPINLNGNSTGNDGTNAGNGNPDNPSSSCDLKPVEDKLTELEDCVCPTVVEVLSSVTYGVTNSGTYGLKPNTRFVTLDISAKPSNPKYESGGAAPDVFYAGWAWYNAAGENYERMPIDAIAKAFAIQPRATGFSFTCRQGYTASVTVHYKP